MPANRLVNFESWDRLRLELWDEELRVVLLEDGAEGVGSLFRHGMDGLDEAGDVGRHHKQVAGSFGAGIPVGVRSAARDEDGGAGADFDVVVSDADDESAFEDVPGFVVGAVEVQRGDEAGRTGGRAGILPFGDDERGVRGAKGVSCERGCEVWGSHWGSRSVNERDAR
jgi:hypothetical protein